MTDKQAKRYVELEGMKFKGYRECDELNELKKDIDIFGVMQIEAIRSEVPYGKVYTFCYETLKHYFGNDTQNIINELVRDGWAKTYEYRNYGRFFYGITLTETPREIFYELYC